MEEVPDLRSKDDEIARKVIEKAREKAKSLRGAEEEQREIIKEVIAARSDGGKGSIVRKMNEDPNYTPRSARFGFKLTATSEVRETPEFKLLGKPLLHRKTARRIGSAEGDK